MSPVKKFSFDVNKNSKQKKTTQAVSEKICCNYEHDLFKKRKCKNVTSQILMLSIHCMDMNNDCSKNVLAIFEAITTYE